MLEGAVGIDPQIHPTWKAALHAEFSALYFKDLVRALRDEKKGGRTVFPPGKCIFYAFEATPLEEVRVVIIGQDPYHGIGQANGLCFSVNREVAIPPSLRNIFKEVHEDLGLSIPEHGDLSAWAKQGVLLLNAMLTVRANEAASHRGLGWETFTDAVISTVSRECREVVFLLWGAFAQGKEGLIDRSKHHVLKSVHPSPLSAYRGFFGCRHFSKANALLTQAGHRAIDWGVV